jgi:hypothetical protein
LVVNDREGGKDLELHLVLVGKMLYLMGNDNALRGLVYFSATAAKREAGRWIAVPSTNPFYGLFGGGLTLSSITTSLDLVGSLTVVPERTVAGHSAVGIRLQHSLTLFSEVETVYVAASGAPLPVEVAEDLSAPIGSGVSSSGPGALSVNEAVVFGPWGEPPDAKAPASSVPIELSWLGAGSTTEVFGAQEARTSWARLAREVLGDGPFAKGR